LAFVKNISTNQPDEELVHQYQSTGNLDVLANLYQRYMDLIYGVCLKYLSDKEDARDCVIQIFEELIIKLKKHEVSHFKGWIYQVAKNHCLMRLRKEKNNPVTIDTEFVHLADFTHQEDGIDRESNFTSMEYCLEQLGEQQRMAITLFYYQEKCYRDIAVETGIELNKVRSFIQNGRRNLKICMENQAMEKQ
jgi:RNA polymerase sigma-70 factor (ECF subfamily)